MNTRTLLLTLLFLALLPTAASAQRARAGLYDARPAVHNNPCYSRPVYNNNNYNRCYSRSAYYNTTPVFFNTGYWGNYGYPYGGFGFPSYGNYGGYYSRPTYSGGNPMVLPKWTTSQKQTEKVEVEEGKPELEVPEIK